MSLYSVATIQETKQTSNQLWQTLISSLENRGFMGQGSLVSYSNCVALDKAIKVISSNVSVFTDEMGIIPWVLPTSRVGL